MSYFYLPHVEVLNIDVLVRCCFSLAPQQQTFFGTGIFNANILNSKSKNNSPDHTESHFSVTITNFFGTNRDQFDTFAGDKVQCFVDVSNFIESCFKWVWFGQSFTCTGGSTTLTTLFPGLKNKIDITFRKFSPQG